MGNEVYSAGVAIGLGVLVGTALFVPFVAAYIWYAWRAMNRRPITREEIRGDDHQY
mgnify:CR=1 FL=1